MPTAINPTANKGEWAEFYAFLKILELRKLPAADKNLDPIGGKNFIFQRIIRRENENLVKIYDISESETEIIITDETGDILHSFQCENLGTKTLKIFEKIKGGASAAFEIPEAADIMNELLCTRVKANSSNKADIVAIIYDRISETMPELGFSVKSMVGGASTLLNAGKTTNFAFKVKGFDGDIEEVNSIIGRSKIRDRLRAIAECGGDFVFDSVECGSFDSNLKNIDTAFPRFIAQMLLDYFQGKGSTIPQLIAELAKNKEFKDNFGLSLTGYEIKMKNFLGAIALGMVPRIEWDGFTKAHGGYIVVKQDGEVVCYHLYDRDEFHTYLYENTKFDGGSSTKHNYGMLYEKDEELFFNLNLQIRFIK